MGAERQEAEIKYHLLAAIDQAIRQGSTVEKSCAILDLERSRYYRWKGRRPLEQLALAELRDQRPGPRPGAGGHRLLEAEKEVIRQAARAEKYQDLHHRKLCHQLSREGQVHISESSVYRLLKAEDLMGPLVYVSKKRLRPETRATQPNQLWGWDVSYLKVKELWMYLIAIIDYYSRKIVGHETSFEQRVEDMKRVWDRALLAESLLDPLGQPINLTALSDNGSPMKAKSMRQFFRTLGIVQEFTRGATPTDNARMETWYKTIKYEKLYREELDDPLTTRRLVDDFVVYYNEERPHQALGYVTPQEKHTGKDVEILARRKEALAKARQTRLEVNRQSVELIQAPLGG